MNKAAIKRFAIEARNKLRNFVTDKAGMLGITPEECSGPVTTGPDFEVYQTAAGTEVTLNKSQCELRKKLVDKIAERGFDAVVEEVAYTWFNRICAIRFMEVNDYLPSRVRVLSSEKDGKNEPDLVTMAPDVDLPFTEEEKEKIYDLKMKGTTAASDELFQKLFIKQCNALHEILPELFEETQDYTELLLDISYANKDDVIYMLVNQEDGIPEADFNVTSVNEQGEVTGQVEIIGWLYQYYNTELKDDTFAKLKKNIKITKERIPAATQLFTPDWIVRYMVENSVGRIWIDHLRALDSSVNEKETAEKFGWKYYLPEAKQEEAVNVKLAEIRSNYKDLKPTDILCIDPCMGSGHILIAMFDVLMDIYTSTGYSEREAAFEIVEHNIHGLDIDQRAYQLAYFAVMMKGRGYNRRFFRGRDDVKPMPKVYAIAESNDISRSHLSLFGQSMEAKRRETAKEQMEYLLDIFKDGSNGVFPESDKYYYYIAFLNSKVAVLLLNIINPSMNVLVGDIASLPIIFDNSYKETVDLLVESSIGICKIDWNSYETSWDFCKHPLMPQREEEGITIFAGMKIGEEKWIKKLENGSACFSPIADYIKKGEKENNNEQGDKYEGVFARLKKNDTRIHDMEDRLKDDLEEIEDGEYILLRRKSSRTVPVFCLYGFYKEDAQMIELSSNNVKLELIPSSKMYNEFLNGVSSTEEKKVAWTLFFSLGHLQHNIQTALDNKHVNYRFAKVQYDLFDGDEFFIEPTSDYPELTHKAKRLSYQKEIRWVLPNIHQSTKYILPYTPLKKESMGCHEGKTNFQFQAEAHIKEKVSIESCYNRWRNESDTRFAQLKANEEELNRIFIDIYGLQDELTPDVADKDVTVRKADLGRDIRSFISYAVGCMFGRYSLDKDGLILAGQSFESIYFEATAPRSGTGVAGAPGDYVPTGEFYIKTEDGTKQCTYNPDRDNIIPITDEEYFSDDIVGRFVEFVETVYGKDTLEENLDFIAQALGNKGNSSREVIRNYFIKDFYKDHLKVYQKRPIYWLFDSGKQNGFKVLIYMHRYDADTVGRVRTDYLHRAQNYVETAMKSAEYTIENTTVASEKSKAMKAVSKYTKQLAEMQTYDQAIAHVANQRIEIDLDDGVKVNYAKFQGVEVAQEGKKALKVDLLAKI